MNSLRNNTTLTKKIEWVYGLKSHQVLEGLDLLEDRYGLPEKDSRLKFSEKEILLITYGDSLQSKDERPLKTLGRFLKEKAGQGLSGVHILPFYPYTSDDGFSVVDYREVNPDLGEWSDVTDLSETHQLMFDGVINHISASSPWFKGYLAGQEKYKNYFIEADPSLDYSSVTRPRALPLLTEVETMNGKKHVWTTFSADQIDLNFQAPEVFLEIMDLLISYAKKGAKYIRLDAIGFMWKELGTSCIHLEQTHELIKIMRLVLDEIVPGTVLITETNVPHKENISYFGNGHDEAHMVYQFPLPPLTLHTFVSEDTTKIHEWINSLEERTSDTTYFNFLASHDGVGMRPVEGILSEEEKQAVVDRVLSRGGKINYRTLSDGTESPYELNIAYVDALSDLSESDMARAKRFLASQCLLLSVQGVPAVYIHSLLGSRNDQQGVIDSGINRRINREKLNLEEVYQDLSGDSLREKIFYPYLDMMTVRQKESAFSPSSDQEALSIDSRLFTLLRHNKESGERILVVINVSSQSIEKSINYKGYDLLGKKNVMGQINLSPNDIMWLKIE